MSSTNKLISIVAITYNQESFIRKALNSFLMQERDSFELEIIIADDASSDNTQGIIKEYENLHPDIIRPILHKKNVGILKNLMGAISAAKGDYIALCEGDDYWTDPKKLSIQFEFLERKTDYSVCFHRAEVVTVGSDSANKIFPTPGISLELTEEGLIKSNFIQTNTVMYRRLPSYKLPERDILPLDWYLHLLHARKGKIGLIDKVMSVYLRHPAGVWWSDPKARNQFWLKNAIKQIDCLTEIGLLYEADSKKLATVNYQAAELLVTISSETKSDKSGEVMDLIMQKRAEIVRSFFDNLPALIDKRENDIKDLLKIAHERFEEIQRLRKHNDQLKLLLEEQNVPFRIKLRKKFRRTIN